MALIKKRLGDVLVEAGYVSQEQIEEALALQKTVGKKLAQILIDSNIITEELMLEALSSQLGLPYINLAQENIMPNVPQLIPEHLAKLHTAIPIRREDNVLTVAMNDPLNIFAVDDIEMATGCEIFAVLATKETIAQAIKKYYGRQIAEKAAEDFKRQFATEITQALPEDQSAEVNSSAIVRLIDSIISQAVVLKASDIHIEPFDDTMRIRFRVDGMLQEIMSPAKSTHSAVITRLKILCNMEIAERRIPQDGRFETSIEGRGFDIRVSTIPTVYGEKCVMRLLERDNLLLSKNDLGFTEENMRAFDQLIGSSYGILLITGPTGSGKTTTLYTVLNELNDVERNIITVEDPVEYRMEGIGQVQVNTKTGLTFASALRSILRQDPDIIMIGEMRDKETAQIAVRSAITGHMVLSTLHTNNTVQTVSRLIDMEIEPYFVSSAVLGVIAQRLLRRVCKECIRPYQSDEEEMAILGIKQPVTLHKGKGCPNCSQTGYRGRIAVHEVLVMSKEVRHAIARGASTDEIEDIAVKQGMTLLYENAKKLAIEGVTTLEEAVRVTYTVD